MVGFLVVAVLYVVLAVVVIWQVIKGILGVVASDENERKSGVKRIGFAILGGILGAIIIQLAVGTMLLSMST